MEQMSFPNPEIDWMMHYKNSLISYLEGSNHSITKRNAKNLLRKIDNVLEVYENPIDEISVTKLYNSSDEFISKADISSQLLDFMRENIVERELNDKGRSLCFNLVKDLRRVTQRALNDEPLYLISEEYRFFKEFVGSLSSSPKTIFNY